MKHIHFFFFPLLIALCLTFAAPAAAQGGRIRQPLPELTDPVDLHVRSLAIMSQQDELIGGIDYNNGDVHQRGCGPVSIANTLFAAFGVTDRQKAADLFFDIIVLFAPAYKYRTEPCNNARIDHVLSPDAWHRGPEAFAHMYALLEQYPGEIHATYDEVTTQMLDAHIAAHEKRPLLISGNTYAASGWAQVVQLVFRLHELGHDEATVCIGHLGAGTSSTDGPLRTSGYGHYVSLYIHVGKFVQDGSIYVLDSLPRAIGEEAYSDNYELRSQYYFVEGPRSSDFRAVYAASRISPTVIRLSYNADALAGLRALKQQAFDSDKAKTAALIQRHTELTDPLQVYGRGFVLITIP